MTTGRSLFERLYRATLLIFPPNFRARFGDEMTDFALAATDDAQRRGAAAHLRTIAALVADALANAPRQWLVETRERRATRAAAIASGALPRDNMDIILQDLRFGARSLLRRPGFTVVAALTLALGIGANTAIFSVVNAVLIRPLGYPNADRIVAIWGVQGTQGQNGIVFPDYLEWRAQNRSFEDMGVYRGQSVNLTGGDTPQRLIGSFVSASYLRLTGATAAQGRIFTDAETEIATKAPVAVVTYEAWQSRFGGDPAILGKTLVLNGQAHTVVGVTPPNMQAPFGRPDVFIPIPYYPNASGLQRGTRGMLALGTLKPGVTIESAERELKALAKQQEDAYPGDQQGHGRRAAGAQGTARGSDARADLHRLRRRRRRAAHRVRQRRQPAARSRRGALSRALGSRGARCWPRPYRATAAHRKRAALASSAGWPGFCSPCSARNG